jgi:PAS domain S-box-containing protein
MGKKRSVADGDAAAAPITRIGYTRPPEGRGIVAHEQGPFTPAETRAFAAAASILAAIAVALALSSPTARPEVVQSVVHALVIATPVLVGLYALHRGAATRFAFLLIAAGFFWAPTLLTLSDESVPYSAGRIWAWLLEVSLVYLVLAFPTGRLTGATAKRLTLAAAAIVALLYLPTALLIDHYPEPSPWTGCDVDCPSNAFMVVSHEPGFVDSVLAPLREVLSTLVFAGVAVYLIGKIARGSRVTRWTLVPVMLVAGVRMLASAGFLIARRIDSGSGVVDVFGLVALLAIPGTALALLFGLIRWRMHATRALRQLTAEIGEGLTAERARDLVSNAIGDPSLEIAYWSGDPGDWVDSRGAPVELPRDAADRAVAEIWAGGHLVAALVTDVTILSEPGVAEVARGFTVMALENRRLDAELGSSLRELRESRARVLAAADKERVRIERDLHDGAQQRLVALRVGLELAAEALVDDPTRARSMLQRLGADMDDAVDEVRTLARGMSPPLLADHGLAEALRAAARRSALSVAVLTRLVGRYPQEIESAVYFCCLEALQNAEKHAQAHSCQIRVWEDDELRFEITDDGIGMDLEKGSRGSGIANMRDRIAAVRGRLAFEPMPEGGTQVLGSVPVGIASLSPEIEMLLQRATDVFQDCFAIYNAVRDAGGEAIDFVVEHVNDAACREVGLPREAQLGRTLSQLRPKYLGADLVSWHLEALAAEGSSTVENVSYGPGSEGARPIENAYDVRAAPLGGGRLAVIWRDITERKRADQELHIQASILKRASEGVCMVRASDGMIVYSNNRFAEILGYTVAELEGQRLADLGWEAEEERDARLRLAEVETLGEVSYEIRARRRDGAPIWLEGHLAAFTHPEYGRLWVIVQQDVTARHQAATTLRLSERPL